MPSTMHTLHRLARTLLYLAVLANFLVTVAADVTALRHDAGHGVQYAANTTLSHDDGAGRRVAGNFSTQMPSRLEGAPVTRRLIGDGSAEGRAGDESGREVWVDDTARGGEEVGRGTVVRHADGQIGIRAGRDGNGAEGAGVGGAGGGRRGTVVGLEAAAPGRQAVSVAVLGAVVLAVLWIWVCIAG